MIPPTIPPPCQPARVRCSQAPISYPQGLYGRQLPTDALTSEWMRSGVLQANYQKNEGRSVPERR